MHADAVRNQRGMNFYLVQTVAVLVDAMLVKGFDMGFTILRLLGIGQFRWRDWLKADISVSIQVA